MLFAPERGETRADFGSRIWLALVTAAVFAGGEQKWIYFIRQGDGPVKIGSTRRPKRRLAHLQTANPEPLTLLAAVQMPSSAERFLHECFADERLEGEWFVDSDELLAVADAAAAVTPWNRVSA